MKKIFITLILLLVANTGYSQDLEKLNRENSIQNRVDEIGANILNKNKIPKRIVFTYSEDEKIKKLQLDKTLTKRQVVVYYELYKHIENDDELAAMLSRKIAIAVKSYGKAWGGWIDSAQITASSKKFEVFADKRAVDYMVNAGYNPLALITYIHKTVPQRRTDRISRHNLASKRLAKLYEYITYKYPEYLKDTEYINNKHYQNFLLNSLENRLMLKEKIRTNSTKELKYE